MPDHHRDIAHPDDHAPVIVGWRERVDLPNWHLRGVRAKIDTGARTSAIDVAQIEELPGGRIRFEVVARVKPVRRTRWITAVPTRIATIRPSHGVPQVRYVCTTRLHLGGHTFDIEVGLVCRKDMLCRMLIGRTALAGRFFVDSSQKYRLTSASPGSVTTLSPAPDAHGPGSNFPDSNEAPR